MVPILPSVRKNCFTACVAAVLKAGWELIALLLSVTVSLHQQVPGSWSHEGPQLRGPGHLSPPQTPPAAPPAPQLQLQGGQIPASSDYFPGQLHQPGLNQRSSSSAAAASLRPPQTQPQPQPPQDGDEPRV